MKILNASSGGHPTPAAGGAELHRQPLRIDLFDIRLFEPMGRQSLVVALVFAGGFLLGAIFAISLGNVYSWLINLPMMFVPVFFTIFIPLLLRGFSELLFGG